LAAVSSAHEKVESQPVGRGGACGEWTTLRGWRRGARSRVGRSIFGTG
jgi:hypothetical protein